MPECKDKYGIGAYEHVTAFLVNDEDKKKVLAAIKKTGCTYRETKPHHVANEYLSEVTMAQYAVEHETYKGVHESDDDAYNYAMDVHYPSIVEKREEFAIQSKDIMLVELPEGSEDFLFGIADKLLGFEKEEDTSVSALDLLKKEAS